MRCKFFRFRLTMAICVMVLTLFVQQFRVFIVSGDSMLPTLKTGQMLLASRLTGSITHGQIIFAKREINNKVHVVVKRVIGLEGDTIEIRCGTVFCNQKAVIENYVKRWYSTDDGYWVVPKNSYFVLGDNRDESLDSRDDSFGFVSQRDVLGILLS